ncbi:MAG: IS110 family transposase [Sinimarinibacterium sp.]
MAKSVEAIGVGVDVSRAEICVCRQDITGVQVLRNEQHVIRRWLRSFQGPVRLAVEATNTYHLTVVEEAHRLGHTVYVVDGYRLSRYRDSVGGRAKTDRTDAELLLRYLEREGCDLRAWSPPPAGYADLSRLLHRRATLVQASQRLRQSLADVPEFKAIRQVLFKQLAQLDRLMQRRIVQLLEHSGTAIDARRCQAIQGVGPLTGAALANAFRRGRFSSSDAFVAFLGLDVRVRDSGTCKGRRRLTKQGDPELRRLLHNAAMAARRTARWQPLYQRYLQRGLKPTQVFVILARKLARIAFALMKNQTDYQPQILSPAA